MSELLADDLAPLFLRGGISCDDLFASIEVYGDAASLISVLRLDDNWDTDFLSGFPRIFTTRDRSAFRHRDANRDQQVLRQFLVLDDRLGHGRSLIGLRRQNAMLSRTVSKLHQTAIIQTARRNASGESRSYDGTGTGAEANLLVEAPNLRQLRHDIERSVVESRANQIGRHVQSQSPDRLFAVLDDALVLPCFFGLSHSAEVHGRTGLSLKFERCSHEQLGENESRRVAGFWMDAGWQGRNDSRQHSPGSPANDIDIVRCELEMPREIDSRFENRRLRPNVWTTQSSRRAHVHNEVVLRVLFLTTRADSDKPFGCRCSWLATCFVANLILRAPSTRGSPSRRSLFLTGHVCGPTESFESSQSPCRRQHSRT